LQYYFFREGYLRLSCEPFDLSTTSVKNLFVHLTNNAIQKNHNQYSKYELGNQLSFPDLQNYCNIKQNGISVRDQLVPKMKELVKLTFNSVQDKFQQCSKKFQFEIYGYDFMVDSGGNLWLIEINTNPCIEESSPLL
jgi:tubulin--tyrosine ligase/tubulin polyglutamylase TTLL9